MRVLIYSHDTYGLGHFRRSLVVSQALSESELQAKILIATGSPRAQSFKLPKGTDTLKLPAILKQPDGSYASRDLDISIEEAVAMRSKLLVTALHEFKPDLVLVDHSPLGVENELVPLLEEANRSSRRILKVLGMRDIVDDASVTRNAWQASGALKAIESIYDRVLVYGSTWVPTTAVELGLDQLVDSMGQKKTRHIGFVARKLPAIVKNNRILVTAGGGGDGQRLLRAFVEFMQETSQCDFGFDVVSGPFLSGKRFRQLENALSTTSLDVEVHRFIPDLHHHVANACGVIGMAGYNTVTEIMAAGCPALLIPRETPRVEQLLRAQRLSERCGFHWHRASELTTEHFERFVESIRKNDRVHLGAIELNGAQNLVKEISSMSQPDFVGTKSHTSEGA